MKTRLHAALTWVAVSAAAIGATSTSSGTAHAQEGSLPVQQFAPAPGGDNNFVTVQGTGVLPSFMPAAGIYLNYAHNPLVLRRIQSGEEVSLVEHHLQLDLIAAMGILDIFEIGLSIPLTLYQTQGASDPAAGLQPAKLDSFTTGDIRLYPKVSIIHDPDGFGLAFLALLTLPTGSPDNLQGNESVTLEPRLAAQYMITDGFRAGLSLGFLWRPDKQDLFNIDVGNELTFGAALEYEALKDQLAIILEGYGKFAIEGDTQGEERPIEVALAARWWPAKAHALTLGVARGLTEGYGSPDFRLYLGYNYPTPRDDDLDGDGIKDSVDQCPVDPEDFDEFEDENGCPDPDNDKDGIPDRVDRCPMDPEDKDGFEDEDGCPDLDNDKDGVLDTNDGPVDASGFGSCRNDPEDRDGFQDEDGCSDPDNDQDGVPDVTDGPLDTNGFGACLNDPEDIDGVADTDGCPETDADGDGILDADDKCPENADPKCNVRLRGRCEIEILDQIYFKYDKYEIDLEKSKPVLDAVADIILKNDWINRIEVQGHTDSDGDAPYNLDLSQRRAEAVVAYFAKKDLAPGRFVAKGYGESAPLVKNDTPAHRAQNRRVQFIILDPVQSGCVRPAAPPKEMP